MKYPFEKLVLVCTGKRCNESGEGDRIRDHLKDLNRERGRKPTVRVCSVSCLDLCDYGPNILFQPSGEVYSSLDLASGVRVYEAEMGDGPPAADKRLQLNAESTTS